MKKNEYKKNVLEKARSYQGEDNHSLGNSFLHAIDPTLFTKEDTITDAYHKVKALSTTYLGAGIYEDSLFLEEGDLIFFIEDKPYEDISFTTIAVYLGEGNAIYVGHDGRTHTDSLSALTSTFGAPLYGSLTGEKIPLQKDISYKQGGKQSISIQREYISPHVVRLTILPKGKTYVEPIYPDLVTVHDTLPLWAMDSVHEKKREKKLEEGGTP